MREIASDDGEARVRLGRQGRQGLRLVPSDWRYTWRPAADATYLVTGASGGIGQLVTTHLAALGARHLALASRRPVRPSAARQGRRRHASSDRLLAGQRHQTIDGRSACERSPTRRHFPCRWCYIERRPLRFRLVAAERELCRQGRCRRIARRTVARFHFGRFRALLRRRCGSVWRGLRATLQRTAFSRD